MVLNQMKDIKMNAFKALYIQRVTKKIEAPVVTDRPTVAVLCGTFNTGKYRLAQTLARFGKKDTVYHVFHISI